MTRAFWVAWVLVLFGLGPVCAQVPAAPTASSPPGKASEASNDRVQQQADNVFKWIKVHADKPRKAAAKAANSTPIQANATEPAAPQPSLPAEVPAVEVAIAPAVAVAPVPEPTAAPPVEKPLIALLQAKPEFPVALMTSLGTGNVKLRFVVQPDGSVANPEVLATSHRRLNRAALEAVMGWRFEPVPVARVAQVELGFKLD